MLYNEDRQLAVPFLDSLRTETDLCIGDNQPYSGHLPGDSMDIHGRRAGRPNVLIEIRNDLIETEAGQIAWAVENSWFNTFVFDTITPDPRPVAWMVAASAITATLTTLLMGTLSDRTRSRWGKRRPYILVGYLLWGLSTILFPTVAYIKTPRSTPGRPISPPAIIGEGLRAC